MKEYFLNSRDEYRLMNQAGVKQYVFPSGSHNAIWDSNIDPNGKLYLGLSTEIFSSGYIRFCEYDYEKNEVNILFNMEDVILPSDRAIRASKIHTSIGFMPDGRIIMTTHTTDKSPEHPTWLPYSYYNHVWEGFAGSNIVIYDPVSKKAENLGIPVPHESIYGSIYHERTNSLYFLGMMRGLLYRYSLDTRRVTEMGKASEDFAFRISKGADGHLYSATRSGWLYKIDTGANRIVDLNFRFEHEPHAYPPYFNELSIGRTGPDGRLYMSVMYGRHFYALDTATGKIEDMGDYFPMAKHYVKGENRHGVFGMDFDQKGFLWYAVFSKNDNDTKPECGLPASLFRWDVSKKGRTPEWAGIIGTPERAGAWVSEICVTKSDIMYIISSNHSLDGPDITAVDIGEFAPHIGETGGEIRDAFFDPSSEYYQETSRIIFKHEELMDENDVAFKAPPKYLPIRLFRELAPCHIEDSCVKKLKWKSDTELFGLCGADAETSINAAADAETSITADADASIAAAADTSITGNADADKSADADTSITANAKYAFLIENGALKWLKPVEQADAGVYKFLSADPVPAKLDDGVKLPYYHGRQYMAAPDIAVEFCGGRIAACTRDGMLALVKGSSVYSLGPVSYNGPVRAMTVNPEKTKLYGVAGDKSDIGSVFSYDDANGLRWLGVIRHTRNDEIGAVGMNILSCCELSPDGKQLAIASDERLGTVMIYDVEEL